jgi:electron transfer flavoprotein beta subunit
MPYHVIVCAGIVPDPLQMLEPVEGAAGPALRNESMLPSVLDPWAAHALYESAALVREHAGSRLWLVSLAPKARLQQVMTTVAQKAPFELVAVDGPSSGFVDSTRVAEALASAIESIAGLDRSRLLLCGGWESASRCSGTTLQMVGERLGILDQFLAVDRLVPSGEGGLEVLERIEGGRHQVSVCEGPPALIGWATGSRPEPANSPQVGMANMRTIVPALQRARPFAAAGNGVSFRRVALPPQRRQTRIVKDQPVEAMAAEIVAWIRGQ